MKNIIQFSVEKGQDGYYVASAMNYAIITHAKTLEDLIKNIHEATELHFEDVDMKKMPIRRTPQS